MNDYAKLKSIYLALKKGKITQDQSLKIINLLKEFIDENIIGNDNIVKTIFEYENKTNKRDIDIRFKSNEFSNKIPDMELIQKELFAIKTIFSELLSKNYFFNFYIYSEIKFILIFYINQSKQTALFDDSKVKFKVSDNEYHIQNQMYKYLFSIFDKLLFINIYLDKKFNLTKLLKSEMECKFTQDFAETAKPFLKKKEYQKLLFEFMSEIQFSTVFHYVRKLRNSMEHNLINPEVSTNISLSIELLFILIIRILIEIEELYKNDDELFNLLKK